MNIFQIRVQIIPIPTNVKKNEKTTNFKLDLKLQKLVMKV